MTKRLLTLALAAFLMWRMKRYYADAPVDGLRWMLHPTATLVTLVTRVPFEWQTGEGYLSRERLFLIAKACAGINFMIAAFGMLVWMLARRVETFGSCARAIVVSLPVSYAAAVLVNALRISVSLWLAARPLSAGWITAEQSHRAAGIACYFAGLTLLYEVARRVDRAPIPATGVALGAPLFWYYGITLAVPLLNGAAGRGPIVLEHALFVLTLPLVFVLLFKFACAARTSRSASLRQRSCRR